MHDGALVITRPPDAAAQRSAAVIADSIRAHIDGSTELRLERWSDVAFDAANVRRFAVVLWQATSSLPIYVAIVLSAGNRLRWGRGKLNRAMEFGVPAGLLVRPAEREVIAFSGIERSVVTARVQSAALPGWQLETDAIFG